MKLSQYNQTRTGCFHNLYINIYSLAVFEALGLYWLILFHIGHFDQYFYKTLTQQKPFEHLYAKECHI